ncbi:hypothetical protein FQN54_004743 [Arachnomyces sp. PD_36]|nr:hypothetical protein FQN54_004743 [Arachnomyces sp. PD_36]
MFASLPPQPPPQNMFYLPHQPSPLSPRSKNIQSSPIFSMPTSQSKPLFPTHRNRDSTRRNNPTTSFSQRYAERISNPAANVGRRRAAALPNSSSPTSTGTSRARQTMPSSSSTSPNDKRRDVFLNRVKRDRDEGRFESRSEQILRMDYLAQRRRYEEAMKKSAPNLEAVVEGAEEVVEEDEIGEIDEDLSEEYDSLRNEFETEEGGWDSHMSGGDNASFEEEDYDSIFMDMLGSQGSTDSPHFNQTMDMDTSGG